MEYFKRIKRLFLIFCCLELSLGTIEIVPESAERIVGKEEQRDRLSFARDRATSKIENAAKQKCIFQSRRPR